MNNVDTLTALLEASPDDDITAYLLTDALMEERDMTRSEANRVVLRVRLNAHDSHDLASAADAMRPESADRSTCLSVIRAACSTDFSLSATIVLIGGNEGPRARCEYRSNPGAWWYDWTVTVGASWLLSALASRRQMDARRECRASRRRRSK